MTIPDTHVPYFREDRKRRQTNGRVEEACCRKANRSFEKGEIWTTVNSAGSNIPPSFAVFPKAKETLQ